MFHADLLWSVPSPFYWGGRYLFVVVDDCNRYVTVHFLKYKYLTVEAIKSHVWIAGRQQTGNFVTTVRTDNGSKSLNDTMTPFLLEKGIRGENTDGRQLKMGWERG